MEDENFMGLQLSVNDNCPDAGEIDASSADPICPDECTYSGDGVCDYGGTDADHETCELGTDCFDCGVRMDDEF